MKEARRVGWSKSKKMWSTYVPGVGTVLAPHSIILHDLNRLVDETHAEIERLRAKVKQTWRWGWLFRRQSLRVGVHYSEHNKRFCIKSNPLHNPLDHTAGRQRAMIFDNNEVHDSVVEQVRHTLKSLGYNHFGLFKSGSAYYGKENPPDYDVVVLLCNVDLCTMIQLLKKDGWDDCAESAGVIPSGGDERTPGYGEVWASVRRGDTNIIMTTDAVWFYREQAATELVRKFALEEGKVLPKEQAIELFAMVRDGRAP